MVVLLIALVVLGPSKLPDAARQVGRALGELRRLSSGFQAEMRDALKEPVDGTPADKSSGAAKPPGAGRAAAAGRASVADEASDGDEASEADKASGGDKGSDDGATVTGGGALSQPRPPVRATADQVGTGAVTSPAIDVPGPVDAGGETADTLGSSAQGDEATSPTTTSSAPGVNGTTPS